MIDRGGRIFGCRTRLKQKVVTKIWFLLVYHSVGLRFAAFVVVAWIVVGTALTGMKCRTTRQAEVVSEHLTLGPDHALKTLRTFPTTHTLTSLKEETRAYAQRYGIIGGGGILNLYGSLQMLVTLLQLIETVGYGSSGD